MAPLLYILDKYDNPCVIISNTGLRDGIFFDYYFKHDGMDWDGMSALERSIENTIINFEGNIVHSRNVARISISLFKQLRGLHKISDDYLNVLYAAAMLRDIGIYVNYDNYRRHSMYLMLNSNIHGLEIKELLMAAMIICFNEGEKTFGILEDSDIEKVKKLACIVNLAGRLDKYSIEDIKHIECTENSDVVQLRLDKNFCLIDFVCQKINEDDEFSRLFGKKLIIG
jgi:exopolyphosphatase/guanosine-5'-triphosphate,3'-diphosphate pyrophosphatase